MQALLAKVFDWPPVWTALSLATIWALSYLNLGFGAVSFGPGTGAACLVLGLWLMGKAFLRMQARGTTVIPHRVPQALVTDSVFAISRNPIYLGDALVLLAATFWTNTLLGFVVLGGFVWVINHRFIIPQRGPLERRFWRSGDGMVCARQTLDLTQKEQERGR